MARTSPNGPVEKKVTVASFTALLTAAIVAYILKSVPWLQEFHDLVEVAILGLVTSGVTFVVSWWTKHTARNDAGTRRTGTSDPIPPTG